MLRNSVAVLAASLVLSACAATVVPLSAGANRTTEQVAETNYTIGEERTAVVGESVIRVKDYTLVRVASSAMTASGNAQWTMGLGSGFITAGKTYPIVGERDVDGVRYRVVEIGTAAVQVQADGIVHNKGLVRDQYGTSWIPVIPAMVISPAVTFAPATNLDETTIASGENFEIVFTGRDSSSMRFQYREYTSENMARPAFSQDLTYPIDAKTIRFRGMVIEVSSVGPDSITYKVVSRARA